MNRFKTKTRPFITFYIDTPRPHSLCGALMGFGVRVARSVGHTCTPRDQEIPFIWRGVMSLLGNDDRQQRLNSFEMTMTITCCSP